MCHDKVKAFNKGKKYNNTLPVFFKYKCQR